MQSDNLIKIIVGGALGVLLLVTLALPVITSATETHTTFTNDGYFKLDKVTEGTVTIEYDYTAPDTLTVNNIDYDVGELAPNDVTVALTDNSFLRFQNGARCTLYTATDSYGARVADQTNMTITASNGSMTVSVTGQNDVNLSYTDLYVISDSGQYVMKKSTESVYVAKDSEFFGAGRSTIGTSNAEFLLLDGSIGDGATFETLNGSENTFSDVAIDAEAVNGYIDLYKLTKVTATATNSTGTSDLTYSYFIVPASVTVENAIHLGNAEITMLELVPLLLAVALVLGIIGYAIRARLS